MCPGAPSSSLCRRSEPGKGVSRPVGRVLCTRLREPTVIHLGLPLPAASCGLPASIGRAALNRSRREPWLPSWPCSGWGLPSRRSHLQRWWSLTPPFHPYPASWTRGGLFSVALSRGSPRVGVTDHPALWSPDLPHRAAKARRDRPADSPSTAYSAGSGPWAALAATGAARPAAPAPLAPTADRKAARGPGPGRGRPPWAR